MLVALGVHTALLAWCAAIRLSRPEATVFFTGQTLVLQAAAVDRAASRPEEQTIEVEPPRPVVEVQPESVRIASRRFVRESARVEAGAGPGRARSVPAARAVRLPVSPVARRQPAESPQPLAKPAPRRPRRKYQVAALASAASVPLAVGRTVDRSPTIIFNPPPHYPAQAIAAGLEGVVRLELVIARTGEVTRVRVVGSSGVPVLDAAAAGALGRWRAAPWDGEPAEVAVEVPVRFRIP